MTENEVDFFPLRVTGVTATGKRRFDPEGKRKLIEACMQPGASIAGLALKAGVNANQLHKWIHLRERTSGTALTTTRKPAPSAFVPVVTVNDVMSVAQRAPAPESPKKNHSISSAVQARLSAQLPNGVTLRLECAAHDAALVRAMIEALGVR
ncbi:MULTISPECIES: IS66-like element accessory protein TnpA [Burkholderiaceae]|jgi:transposase|uniref:Transposase n=1 Tax=Burkholderia glumae TaxID=337 RepID=A0A246MA95_BURGL|nr:MULTISPECIES: transposase [Burkholderiaceae]ACR29045.1 Transposase IS3/IS911 [Burkholderia glumae BGR1]ACR29436.1 Transposase IS3/IS911 [Burkholderia glumae BGR1]ACR31226.1 Transposase IS3/IS911 [Burkholderia glumae BGR1]ACR32588.1 Transposase IS3/IS911 [Burkholderia glumae BGR1]ACR32659.1 Transposase IS3/IS911 [Burkholderia glumae BGR1]